MGWVTLGGALQVTSPPLKKPWLLKTQTIPFLRDVYHQSASSEGQGSG